VVAVAAGALGALDDLAGGASDKGLRGHLGALVRGEVTTGAVKILGLGVAGLLGAALADRQPSSRPGVLSTLVGGAVVAGAANAVNLFDLRPGRALKVTVAVGLPLVGTVPGAAAVGAALGVVRDDLRASAMLGDTGANAAGALVGLAFVERTGLAGRTAALIGLAALTLASERVSFTRVIEAHPLLRRVDEWGRGLR
jgi:UDP-N-acetylmuramyl pentapeptide phosphotransferase/UDP-N-acetylglucosamine-1-phosphate transferase